MKPKTKAKPVERRPGLAPELQRVLEEVGPENYARATASDFTKGGRYNPTNTRPKYAKM